MPVIKKIFIALFSFVSLATNAETLAEVCRWFDKVTLAEPTVSVTERISSYFSSEAKLTTLDFSQLDHELKTRRAADLFLLTLQARQCRDEMFVNRLRTHGYFEVTNGNQRARTDTLSAIENRFLSHLQTSPDLSRFLAEFIYADKTRSILSLELVLDLVAWGPGFRGFKEWALDEISRSSEMKILKAWLSLSPAKWDQAIFFLSVAERKNLFRVLKQTHLETGSANQKLCREWLRRLKLSFGLPPSVYFALRDIEAHGPAHFKEIENLASLDSGMLDYVWRVDERIARAEADRTAIPLSRIQDLPLGERVKRELQTAQELFLADSLLSFAEAKKLRPWLFGDYRYWEPALQPGDSFDSWDLVPQATPTLKILQTRQSLMFNSARVTAMSIDAEQVFRVRSRLPDGTESLGLSVAETSKERFAQWERLQDHRPDDTFTILVGAKGLEPGDDLMITKTFAKSLSQQALSGMAKVMVKKGVVEQSMKFGKLWAKENLPGSQREKKIDWVAKIEKRPFPFCAPAKGHELPMVTFRDLFERRQYVWNYPDLPCPAY